MLRVRVAVSSSKKSLDVSTRPSYAEFGGLLVSDQVKTFGPATVLLSNAIGRITGCQPWDGEYLIINNEIQSGSSLEFLEIFCESRRL